VSATDLQDRAWFLPCGLVLAAVLLFAVVTEYRGQLGDVWQWLSRQWCDLRFPVLAFLLGVVLLVLEVWLV